MPVLYTFNVMKKPPPADYLLQVTSYTRKRDWTSRSIGVWCPQLAPSKELTDQVNDWKQNNRLFQNWDGFVVSYLEEQRRKPAHLEQVYRWLEGGRSVALGCFCEEPCVCVRSLLAEIILQRLPQIAVDLR
ncbi:MAG: DUF488 family protein [Firmicutes bacterium]|nr:DUF488 family protein [Bacillota bacterium]